MVLRYLQFMLTPFLFKSKYHTLKRDVHLQLKMIWIECYAATEVVSWSVPCRARQAQVSLIYDLDSN